MHKPDLLLYRHLFTSDLYSINEFSYECGAHYCFDPGFTKELCISFTRKGYLTFNSFRQSHEECNTRVLIEKPGCEFTLQHRGPGSGCTDLPITDVCFRSGFNRLDYFSAAFTKKFHIAPSKYKRQLC